MKKSSHHVKQMMENTSSMAAELFDIFCGATTMRQILGLHRNICDLLNLRPATLNEFYPKLKSNIRNWKAQALWKKFDVRAAHKVYCKGNACNGCRVLIIGAGPCGLRSAIEAQLMGAKVVVIEKRDRITRNNVVHLWPFVITDLRNLGAKKFYGKFCAGSIDHISIRQLQCILLKVALLLGVEIHESVSFLNLIEPVEGFGWRANVSPEGHGVSHYEFDVLIGADGKRNTLDGFKRKEFRGKLAIAITANFVNKRSEAEARAEEISGVAFIFNQSFFKELYQTTGIDLENIVYYKDDTHYFVMTAKKHSLIYKSVIKQDFLDPAELLAPINVNTEKLLDYAREAADFSTKYQMPNLDFALNHYGKPDVAMFDFTSMFASESSARVLVRKNYRLLECLVGDSLLEPFWPTGSGCARGFLSSMDAAYMIKLWANPNNSILGILAQRESIYRILAQTTPENLQRDIGAYTVDPASRYPNLNKFLVTVSQVKHLLDTDDENLREYSYMDTNDINVELISRRKRRTEDILPRNAILLKWVKTQLNAEEVGNITELSECITKGNVLCALINRFRPDLIDRNSFKDLTPIQSNELAFGVLETKLNIPHVINAQESISLKHIDSKLWVDYLEQLFELFRGEIPYIKHPKLDVQELRNKFNTTDKKLDFSRLLNRCTRKTKSTVVDRGFNEAVYKNLSEEIIQREQQTETSKRSKKRRSQEKSNKIDRERFAFSSTPRICVDGPMIDRIKTLENQILSKNVVNKEKKPKDLLRAIGRLESNDWQIREIEKKINQSKKTVTSGKTKEKVPKWSKEQFIARQNKMAKVRNAQREETDEKFKVIDETLKNLDNQLKHGALLQVGERGKNKVASIACQFVNKQDSSDEKLLLNTNTKVNLVFNKQMSSEKCHFCKQTVYLMEKISAEGLNLHRSCLKCHHCQTNLRLGNYTFDREDPDGRFYCNQHFKLPAKTIPSISEKLKEKQLLENEKSDTTNDDILFHQPEIITRLQLSQRRQTPERIEFENTDEILRGDCSLANIMDENEWTDRNFITDEDFDSDSTSSNDTNEESDIIEDNYQSSPIAQTLQLASDWLGKQKYCKETEESDFDFYDSSEELLDDKDADSLTDGEEILKARELRRQEVKLLPIPTNLPTDTETEIQSESESSSADEQILNSATEISTDSEFDEDPAHKKNPQIFIDETYLRKSEKLQIKSFTINNQSTKVTPKIESSTRKELTKTSKQINISQNYQFKPLVQVDQTLIKLNNPRIGDNFLNKTASTEGIASKKSLELKKQYLLGSEAITGCNIIKSDSTSVLDSKLKKFHSNITECQKLLNCPKEISPHFLNNNAAEEMCSPIQLEKTIQKIKSDHCLNSCRGIDQHNTKSYSYDEITKLVLKSNIISSSSTNIVPLISKVKPFDNSNESLPCSNSNQTKFKVTCLRKPILHMPSICPNNMSIIPSHDNHSFSMNNKETLNDDIAMNKIIIPNILSQTNVSQKQKLENIDKTKEYSVTSIKVPKTRCRTTINAEEYLENESLTSENSSSISLNEIPQCKLDSKSNPETLNICKILGNQKNKAPVIPRLEIHDSSGTLMQIDNIIITNSPIGYREDFKLMQISADMKADNNITSDIKNFIQRNYSKSRDNNQISKKKTNLEKNKNCLEFNSSKLVKRDFKTKNKFDSKNKNKVESLQNLPLVLDQINTTSGSHVKPIYSHVKPISSKFEFSKTIPNIRSLNQDNSDIKETFIESLKNKKQSILQFEKLMSDSETEANAQAITETELSDWTADDAVSENFFSENKETFRRNINLIKEKTDKINRNSHFILNSNMLQKTTDRNDNCGILGNLNIEDIEFMDTGSESSISAELVATNRHLFKNRGYFQFTENDYEIEMNSPINQHFCPEEDGPSSILCSQALNTSEEKIKCLAVITSPFSNVRNTNDSELSVPLMESKIDILEQNFCNKSSQGTEKNSLVTGNFDEIVCEDYFKRLQLKILQISKGKELIDSKSSRRKRGESYYDEMGETVNQNKIKSHLYSPTSVKYKESINNKKCLSKEEKLNLLIKLEEINKERTKQKDLIHDLVMTKLQSKRQSDMKKRLNRSKNFDNCNNVANNTHRKSIDILSLPMIESKDLKTNEENADPNISNKLQFLAFHSDKFATDIKKKTLITDIDITNYSAPDNFSTDFLSLLNKSQVQPSFDKQVRASTKIKRNHDLAICSEENLSILLQKCPLTWRNRRNDIDLNSNEHIARHIKMTVSKSVTDVRKPILTHNNPSEANYISAKKIQLKESTSNLNINSDSNLTDCEVNSRKKNLECRKSLVETITNVFIRNEYEKDKVSRITEHDPCNFSSELRNFMSSQIKPLLENHQSARFRGLNISSKTTQKSKSCLEMKDYGFDEYQQFRPKFCRNELFNETIVKYMSTPDLYYNNNVTANDNVESYKTAQMPLLSLKNQRSKGESYKDEFRYHKKQRSLTKVARQAEFKRIRIAQEIQREQGEIEVKLREYEARGVLVEKALRGVEQNVDSSDDVRNLKDLLEIWRHITELKKRDEQLGVRQQELKLEHRHAMLIDELNLRLSNNRKTCDDVAAEGAILNEMLEIVAKQATLRPNHEFLSILSNDISFVEKESLDGEIVNK